MQRPIVSLSRTILKSIRADFCQAEIFFKATRRSLILGYKTKFLRQRLFAVLWRGAGASWWRLPLELFNSNFWKTITMFFRISAAKKGRSHASEFDGGTKYPVRALDRLLSDGTCQRAQNWKRGMKLSRLVPDKSGQKTSFPFRSLFHLSSVLLLFLLSRGIIRNEIEIKI